MAKSHKSATLPSNFLLKAQPVAEDNEGFFSKLKKRLKFKKGKYNVDVNTGECENVSAVSFKKRQSRELLGPEDESPLKYNIGRSSERVTRSASPKTSKPAARTHSERIVSGSKETFERSSLKIDQDDDDIRKGSTVTKQVEKEVVKGNEYSHIKFDREDPVLTKPANIASEPKVKNDCLLNDDSAIDLDSFDVDSNHDAIKQSSKSGGPSSHTIDPLPIDPGYEKLPLMRCEKDTVHDIKLTNSLDEEPGYASVGDVKKTKETHRQGDEETDALNFDPCYESIKDIKSKVRRQTYHDERISKSVESLDDPNYQSINDVKRKKEELFGANGQKPRKTYSMFESIESLDEPGYESLNDVKKRIHEQNFRKTVGPDILNKELKASETDNVVEEGADFDDSAVGSTNDSVNVSECATSEGEHVGTSELTESAKSKDSGFESKTEKSPEHENAEDLYSKVRKRSEEPATVTEKDQENPKDPETKPTKDDGFDSDVELSLDPGYAECADAIKGFVVPLSIYSDGSGSKMSSCNSLDLSVEDFITEPGYAECADAIKTGVIKKISVSNERLVDAVKVKRHSVDEAILRKGAGPEIYANPQILFRKRSKLLDDTNRNSGEFTGSSESLMSNSSVKSKEVEVIKEESTELEAPPLPARNYSLYLDSEEADKIVPSPESLDLSGKQLEDIDDAFEDEQSAENDKHSIEEKVDVNAILKMEQDLKEELRHEPVLKTPDDVDEVTRAIESKFPDAAKVAYDPLAELEDDPLAELEDDPLAELEEDRLAELEVDEETCLSGEFLVKIPLETGGTKFLKISEKKESTHIQEKRKSVRHASDPKQTFTNSGDPTKTLADFGNSSCGSKTSPDCDPNKCDIFTEQTDLQELTKHISRDSEIVSISQQLAADTGNEQVNAYHRDSCNNTSEIDSNICPKDIVIPGSNFENFRSANDDRTRLKQDLESFSEQNDTTERTSAVSAGGGVIDRDHCHDSPLRMISLSSMDSDDELYSVEPLPKLEIVEREWETAFNDTVVYETNNIKGLDRVDSGAGKECAKDTNDVFKEVDNASALVKVGVEIKEEPDRKDGITYEIRDAVEDVSNVDVCAVSDSDKKATLDTRLVVVLSTESARSELLENGIALNVETSEGQAVNSSVVSHGAEVLAEKEGDTDTDEENPPVKVTTPRLCELTTCNNMIPNLYTDTEPTHMSLEEVMQLSKSDISALRSSLDGDNSLTNSSSSSIDGHSGFLGTTSTSPFRFSDAFSHIPSSSETPPPRPPPHSSLKSSTHTPTDEVPPPYRLAPDGTLTACSAETSPPALPPRPRNKKQPRPVSESQDFMESMRQLKDCGWYWGPLSWQEAEQKLANKPEGTFLVRDSSDERYILSLSFKNQGRVHHTRIEHHKGHFSFWSQPDSHGKSTIKEFIEQCVNNSRNGRFLYFIRPSGPGSPPMPIHLLHPVSRFVQLYSLQHMCRFRILQMVRRDHIDSLPVPTRIKQYLKEAQYYVEYLDD